MQVIFRMLMAAAKRESSQGSTPKSPESEHASIPSPEPSAPASNGSAGTAHASGGAAPPKPKLLKKLVAKDIVTRKQLVYKKDDDGKVVEPEERSLYRVFGIANGTETGESQYGPWVGFKGTFEAIRFSDRARFQSSICFLQEPAEGMLLAALAEAQKREAGASLSFSFDVGVKPSQKWVELDQGNTYEYTLASSLKVEKNDPLASIRGDVMEDLPALPAPTAS